MRASLFIDWSFTAKKNVLWYYSQTTSLRLHKVFAITAANGEVIHHVTGGGGVEADRKWNDQQVGSLIFIKKINKNAKVLKQSLLLVYKNYPSAWTLNCFIFSFSHIWPHRVTIFVPICSNF